MPGFGEILLVVAVVVLVFNARRLPELGSSLGRTLTAFRKGLSGKEDERKSRDVRELDADRDEERRS